MAGLIAVHVGAGYHAENKRKVYKEVCKRACNISMNLLRSQNLAVDVVTEAVSVLEDSPFTNAGIGSNLTLSGDVECDACVMDGKSLNFGSVGAAYGLKNPVKVACTILKEQCNGLLPLGRIPPCTLVGKGALRYALNHGYSFTDPSSLITQNALQQHSKSVASLNSITNEEVHLDTVGAVCVDIFGNVASAVSSGGLLLKHPGRIGQAAVLGAGCWACNGRTESDPHIAVSVSGVGEFLMKTVFAKECSHSLSSSSDAFAALPHVLQHKFVDSPYLSNYESKSVGVLAISHNHSNKMTEILWGHTTKTFVTGYMSVSDKKPYALVSEQPQGVVPGKSIISSGKTFIYD